MFQVLKCVELNMIEKKMVTFDFNMIIQSPPHNL